MKKNICVFILLAAAFVPFLLDAQSAPRTIASDPDEQIVVTPQPKSSEAQEQGTVARRKSHKLSPRLQKMLGEQARTVEARKPSQGIPNCLYAPGDEGPEECMDEQGNTIWKLGDDPEKLQALKRKHGIVS